MNKAARIITAPFRWFYLFNMELVRFGVRVPMFGIPLFFTYFLLAYMLVWWLGQNVDAGYQLVGDFLSWIDPPEPIYKSEIPQGD